MARQGWQKALENCTSVARSPSRSAPTSPAVSLSSASRPRTVILPFRLLCAIPKAPASASTARHTTRPVIPADPVIPPLRPPPASSPTAPGAMPPIPASGPRRPTGCGMLSP
ncbi:hypothetical protein GCM10023079_21010 [Streptomyces chitinivorans]